MTEASPSPDNETIFDLLLKEEHGTQALYAALYYAALGLPVFPVKIVVDKTGKEQKTPCIKDWPNAASTDSAVVARWWTELAPGAMVGVVTGHRSGWGVIDVDCKNGGGGYDSLQRLADEIAPPASNARELAFGDIASHERLKPAGIAQTRSGGLHLWYRLGERSKVRGRNKIRGLPNLEFKATGHYVVAPPSEGYVWLRHLPAESEPGVASEEFLSTCPPIPPALLARLLEETGGDSDSPDDDGLKIVERGVGDRLLTEAVRTLMTTPEGSGNDTVYQVCCDLYPYVPLGELTKVQVDQAVAAGIRGWGADEGTIAGTMASAWRRTGERTVRFNTDTWPAAMNGATGRGLASLASLVSGAATSEPPRLTVVPPPDDDTTLTSDSVTADPPVSEDEMAAVRELIPADMRADTGIMGAITQGVATQRLNKVIRDVYQAIASGERAWLETDLGDVDMDPVPNVLITDRGVGLCYSAELNMIWGKRSAGKSWLTAEAVRQVVDAGLHAVILDYENGRPRIRNRLRQIGLSTEQISRYVHVFMTQTGGVPIKRLGFDPSEVGVVIIDSMTGALRAMDLDSLRGDDVETFNQRLVAPFKDAGACVIALDHVTQDDSKHDRPINSVHKLNMVQGTGYQVETVVPFAPEVPGWSWIRLWKDNGGGTDKVPGDNVARLCVSGSHDLVRVTVSTDTTSLAVMQDAAVDKVDEAVNKLNELDIPTDVGIKRAAELLRASGYSVGQNVVGEAQKRRRVDQEDDEDTA